MMKYYYTTLIFFISFSTPIHAELVLTEEPDSVVKAIRVLGLNNVDPSTAKIASDCFAALKNTQNKEAHIVWRFLAALIMTGNEAMCTLHDGIVMSGYSFNDNLLSRIGYKWSLDKKMNNADKRILDSRFFMEAAKVKNGETPQHLFTTPSVWSAWNKSPSQSIPFMFSTDHKDVKNDYWSFLFRQEGNVDILLTLWNRASCLPSHHNQTARLSQTCARTAPIPNNPIVTNTAVTNLQPRSAKLYTTEEYNRAAYLMKNTPEHERDMEGYMRYLVKSGFDEMKACAIMQNISDGAFLSSSTVPHPSTARTQLVSTPTTAQQSLSVVVNKQQRQMAQAMPQAVIKVPLVARGHEAFYRKFFNTGIIYRPNTGSDVGIIKLPFRDLANPLEGTLDLSKCGDTGKYLSISTGYNRNSKRCNHSNNKAEIWITPRFIVERDLQTSAQHFGRIMENWPKNCEVGIFWTLECWDEVYWYDYFVSETFESLFSYNLKEIVIACQPALLVSYEYNRKYPNRTEVLSPAGANSYSKFDLTMNI